MKKHQTVLTPGQMKELICAVNEGIPADLSPEAAQKWIGRKKQLAAQIRQIFSSSELYSNGIINNILSSWLSFYKEIGYDCADLSSIIIPENPGDFNRAIIMAQGITPQIAYDLCAKHFKCWKYTNEDLDKIITSDRDAGQGAYAIRIRDRVEADEELKNLSYNDLKAKNILGITFEERLIYELKYYLETHKHLDINNYTLCSGSLFRDGDVPDVDWSRCFYSRLVVHWYFPGYARGSLRSRRAVV